MSALLAIHLSEDVETCIADNKIDLLKELQRELGKQGMTVERGTWPMRSSGEGAKCAELIILASGATSALVASAIARVIDAIGRYKAVVEEKAYPAQPPSKTDVSLGELHVSLEG
jgi:hypothetical protein